MSSSWGSKWASAAKSSAGASAGRNASASQVCCDPPSTTPTPTSAPTRTAAAAAMAGRNQPSGRSQAAGPGHRLAARRPSPSRRAAARIRLGATPATNTVVQIYGAPGLYATGVQEIEIDNSQNVYVLDKRNWTNSRLLRFNRDSGAVTGDVQLTSVGNILPTAFHVSRKDGQIFLADSWGGPSASLLVLSPTTLTKTREIPIRGLGYISDLAEYAVGSSSRTIWAAGFSLPIAVPPADLTNNSWSQYPPLFKPMLAEIPLSGSGPIDAKVLSEYGEDGKDYLSLPLSIVCTGDDY